nr:immunoglobulin light chain junction region [Macaca mulatta]
CHKYSSPPYSF